MGSASARVLRTSAPSVAPRLQLATTSTQGARAQFEGTSSSGVADRVQVALTRILTTAGQVSLLWFFGWVGHEVVTFLHLSVPGNVAGLVLLLLALLAGVVPLRFVERGAALLLGYLPLFFVPLAVGLGNLAELLATHGFAILLILVGSAAVGFAVTGKIAQHISRLQADGLVATRRSDDNVDPDCR